MAAGVRHLIDAGCLALLWRLTRRERIRLFDLLGFDRARLVPDVLLGFALVPVGLAFILGGIYATGWLLYGTLTPPYLFGRLPLPAPIYGVLIFPFVWGLTEQMTYNGYLVPRFQVLCRSTGRAVALVAFAWSRSSRQHASSCCGWRSMSLLLLLSEDIPLAIPCARSTSAPARFEAVV